MRGKAPPHAVKRRLSGITPAYAGKRCCHCKITPLRWDHPRVCGEKGLLGDPAAPCRGSPPRMRGKVFGVGYSILHSGITPAYAGKSDSSLSQSCAHRDHPRVCGEKHAVPVSRIWSAGSPPRMRGKAAGPPRSRGPGGITPAYAGKSAFFVGVVGDFGDHPRVCGEKTKKIPSHRPFQLHPVPVSFSFA